MCSGKTIKRDDRMRDAGRFGDFLKSPKYLYYYIYYNIYNNINIIISHILF